MKYIKRNSVVNAEQYFGPDKPMSKNGPNGYNDHWIVKSGDWCVNGNWMSDGVFKMLYEPFSEFIQRELP